MADKAGQADIRGLDIDKLVKGFADEEIILKKYVNQSTTKAREIRYFTKTAGFLDSSDSTGITASQIANVSFKAKPVVIGPQWSRSTTYVRKYFVESETISMEDIKDTDIDVLATTIRDLVRAVAYQVDLRIWDVISESQSASNINSVSITNEWDDYSNATPIIDLLNAKRLIRNQSYDPEGAILFLNPNEHTYLMNWLINTKGSSIPQFASRKLVEGSVMEILGLNVVISTVVTADYALVMIPNRAATWKSFVPITSVVIDEPGIGKKVRVWEEGECILHDPKAVTLLDNVGPS
jgi:hypothetical protein